MPEAKEQREIPRVLGKKDLDSGLRQRELPTTDEEETLNRQEQAEIRSGQQDNIFDYCDALANKGEMVGYDITRNNSFVAKKMHPYSWEKIQAEFGEGNYRVMAKSEATKQYLKQQTRFVGPAPAGTPSAHVAEKVDVAAEVAKALAPFIAQMQTPKKDAMKEFSEMAILIKSLTPAPEARPPANDGMKELMQLMMQQQQNQQANTEKMIERLEAARREDARRAEERLAEIAKASTASSKGNDWLEYMTRAEDRAAARQDEIEERAHRYARRIAGGEAEEETEKEPKSMLERVLTASLPSLLPGVIANMTKPQAPAPLPQEAAPQTIMSARPLRTAQVPNSVQPNQAGNITIPRPAQTTPPPGVRTTLPPGVKRDAVVVAKPSTVKAAPEVAKPVQKVGPTKEQLAEELGPLVLTGLMAADPVKFNLDAVKKTQDEAAMSSANLIREKFGVSVAYLLQTLPHNDMLAIANQYPLPPEAFTWLEGYYASLQSLRTPA